MLPAHVLVGSQCRAGAGSRPPASELLGSKQIPVCFTSFFKIFQHRNVIIYVKTNQLASEKIDYQEVKGPRFQVQEEHSQR